MKLIIHSHSPEESSLFASGLSKILKTGNTLALYGNLGTGKTYLTQKIAKCIGVTTPVTSPTYPIIQEYKESNPHLVHMDWYRLSDEDELLDIGVDTYFNNSWLCIIEWPERAWDLLPVGCIILTLTTTTNAHRVFQIDFKSNELTQEFKIILRELGFCERNQNEFQLT